MTEAPRHLPGVLASDKDGRAVTANAIQRMSGRRGEAVGITGLHPHMFRRGFADARLASDGQQGDLVEPAGCRPHCSRSPLRIRQRPNE